MSYLPCTYKKAELTNGAVSVIENNFPRHLLNENTVVIRPDYMGICRADIKEIIGSRDIPTDRGPLFGHELVGPVVFAGTSTGFQEGELVTFNPNITPNRTTGFAEYMFVQGADAELDQAIIRVPEYDIIHKIWMPEPMACIVHATRKLLELAGLTTLEGKHVGILGAGCSGLMFALYAKHRGASVCLFNRGEMRRKFALDEQLLKADEVYSLTDTDAQRNTFDVAIVVSTRVTQDMLKIAANLAADNAIMHIYGGTRENDTFLTTSTDIDIIRRKELIQSIEYAGKRLKISGAYGCYKEDYEESFRLHNRYPEQFPLEKIVSKEIDFENFSQLVMHVASGEKDYPGKVVVRTNFE